MTQTIAVNECTVRCYCPTCAGIHLVQAPTRRLAVALSDELLGIPCLSCRLSELRQVRDGGA